MIEALEIEQDRTEGHDHDEDPLVIAEWIDRFLEVKPLRAVKPEQMRDKQREREQKGVENLLELGV